MTVKTIQQSPYKLGLHMKVALCLLSTRDVAEYTDIFPPLSLELRQAWIDLMKV